MIGKAVLIILAMSHTPDGEPEVYTSVSLVESLGNERAVLASCESHGQSLLKEYEGVILGYSCELFKEGKAL